MGKWLRRYGGPESPTGFRRRAAEVPEAVGPRNNLDRDLLGMARREGVPRGVEQAGFYEVQRAETGDFSKSRFEGARAGARDATVSGEATHNSPSRRLLSSEN
jgi:hypothetical protein